LKTESKAKTALLLCGLENSRDGIFQGSYNSKIEDGKKGSVLTLLLPRMGNRK